MGLVRLSIVCVCLLAALPARAEIAGQVLSVVGDALALRAGRILRLFPGAGVESGDQIHTGPASAVEIRFTDWGVISLRARTDFVVDEYVYEQRGGGRERAYFSLLKGGVRSLTGLIGRRDHSNYLLRAPIATIGVRGTHYSVLMCRRDCANADGSLGEDGLYGAVAEGRIAVSPYGSSALEREFGAGERFRLTSENSVPTPLFSLPPFFANPLDPQARANGVAPSPVTSVGDVVAGAGSALTNPDPVAGMVVSTLPAAGTLVSPLANEVVLPAAGLAGSVVNSALSMPALGQVAPLAGSALNVVPAVVAPVLSTATGAVNTVVPVVPPVAVPVAPPATVPTLPPVTVPTLPPVTTPTLPPVTAPAPAPPTVVAPLPPPPVALPTLPSLPLSKSVIAPLRR